MRTGYHASMSTPPIASDSSPIVADRNSPQKHVWRARIVLLTADGLGTAEIMREARHGQDRVWRWQERFMQEGVDGLLRDKTRPSRIPPLPPEVAERVVALTLGPPPGETTHWTAPAMAKAAGDQRQLRCSASGARTACSRTGCGSSSSPTTRNFAAKVRDVVGLYVDPPAHAVVLSVDEKSQIQALDRTQPGLPLKRGRCGTMTHDYKRNGTTTLFAALDVLDGKVIGRCMQRHRHQEFIRFLNAIEAEVPAGKLVHAILDNYAAHKHPKVMRLARPPSALDLPLHADLGLLAQRRRGLLRQTHQAATQARRLPLPRRASGRHQPLPRRDQRQPETLSLDRRPRHDHRRRQPRAPSVRFDPRGGGPAVVDFGPAICRRQFP